MDNVSRRVSPAQSVVNTGSGKCSLCVYVRTKKRYYIELLSLNEFYCDTGYLCLGF